MEISKVIFVVAKGIMNCKIGVKNLRRIVKFIEKVDIYRVKKGLFEFTENNTTIHLLERTNQKR